jgi:hypothetical protein
MMACNTVGTKPLNGIVFVCGTDEPPALVVGHGIWTVTYHAASCTLQIMAPSGLATDVSLIAGKVVVLRLGTCDQPCCDNCAREPDENVHHCQDHWGVHEGRLPA